HAIDGKQVVAGWSADDTETSAQQLSSELPPNWTVCGLSIDQARDVLFITRYGRDQEPIVLSLPMRAIDSESFDKPDMSSKSVFDGAYQQLRLIIAESDATMKSGGACATEAEKRAWWERRAALDQQLGELLGSIEDEWLGAFRHVLDPTVRFSASDGQRLRKSIGQCLVKSLPKTFAAKARTMELATEVCMLVARVLQKATDAEDDGNDWLDVCSLIWDTYVFQGAAPPSDDDTLRAFSEQLREAVQEYVGVFGEAEGGEHLILVLDKHSQQIPWECLPCIRDVPISRMPSVAFLRQRIAAMRHGNSRLDSPSSSELSLSSLAQRSSYSRGRALTPEPGSGPSLLSSLAFDDCVPDTKRNASNGMAGASVSGRRVFYVLNPEGDLHRTQSNFEAHLQGQREWSGVVGRRPMNSECEHALQSSDIFLYFGHGGGERYVSRTQIRALDRCAVALLLGCSSGQLSLAGEFDALGTATDYMVGGCPALLGNLWDVGDKDIDRFAASLLQIWGLASHSPAPIAVNIDTEHCQRLSNAPTSLAEAVCWARKACRMSFLTGAAPVVYGVPVYLM
ncbi:separin protein, partial [Coemansia sp. Cherry 401B]